MSARRVSLSRRWEPAFRNRRWAHEAGRFKELIAPLISQISFFFSPTTKKSSWGGQESARARDPRDKREISNHRPLSGAVLSQFLNRGNGYDGPSNRARHGNGKTIRRYCLLGITFYLFIPLSYMTEGGGVSCLFFFRLEEEINNSLS